MRLTTSRRQFVNLVSGTLLAGDLPRFSKSVEARTLLDPFHYEGVRLSKGRLRDQYLATRDYYYDLPDDDILKGFRKRVGLPAPGNDMGAWGSQDTGMVFGQWLSGMARMHKATGDVPMRDKARHLMLEWAKTIQPDGMPYDPALAKEARFSHYAWDKLLGGILDVYEYTGDRDALPLAGRITDWAAKTLDRARTPPSGFDISGFPPEWYTLCENLYRAWQLTGNSKYKAFGDLWCYDYYWGMFTGRTPLNPRDFHAYSHVNTLSSAAMTYAVTGEPEYLKTIVNAYDYFQRAQCYATGGYGPSEKLVPADGTLGKLLEREANTFETPCGSWAVFKLGRYLLQFTGEARFGDWIERLVYNGIGAALPMASGGRTFYYADYTLGPEDRIGTARKVYYWDPYPCCSGTYIQAVADYHDIIYFKDHNSLYVNLFVPSTVTWSLNGQRVRGEQETSYPESEISTFTVRLERSAEFSLRFRVPGWAEGAALEVNEKPFETAAQPGTWATVRRLWDSGDRVAIRIPMRVRLVPVDDWHPHRVALAYGPVVLVQDARYTLRPRRLPSDQNLSRWIIRESPSLKFRVAEPPAGVFAPTWGSFLPYYQVGAGAPYRMYFDLQIAGSAVGTDAPEVSG